VAVFTEGNYPTVNPVKKKTSLQRVHVGKKVLNLFRGEYLSKAGHCAVPGTDDFTDSFVICGEPARQEWLFENFLHARALLASRGIGLMTTLAVVVIHAAAGGLLRIKPKFHVAFAPFNVAAEK